MKIKDLLALLSEMNPEADVIIHRDVENYGYGPISKLDVGTFEPTDYGNDFWPGQTVIVNLKQVKAVCLYSEDYKPDPVQGPFELHKVV